MVHTCEETGLALFPWRAPRTPSDPATPGYNAIQSIARIQSTIQQTTHLPIQLVHCVVRVSVIIKLHESESLFDQKVVWSSELLEEPLEILLPDPRRHVADVHTASSVAHGASQSL